MVLDPGNSSINSDIGHTDGFKIGPGKDFGKNDAQIGVSGGSGEKSGVGNSSLDSLYSRVHSQMAVRAAKTQENSTAKTVRDKIAGKTVKVENGPLEYKPSISVGSAIKKTIEIMDKNDAFKMFGAKTTKDKIRVAKGLIDEIEGKEVGWNSYLHKSKANDTARRILNSSITELGGFKKRENYTRWQANRAIAGTIGDLTRNKEIMRRANRT
jgi:hypothetical protein